MDWHSWCENIANNIYYSHKDIQNIQETLDTFKKQQRRMLLLIMVLVSLNGILLFYK